MVQELLNRGWLPLLLRWLGLVHRPNLQVEALSALTTVAQTTTEHTPLLLKVSFDQRSATFAGFGVLLKPRRTRHVSSRYRGTRCSFCILSHL